jgi:hypothetical protein
LCQPGSIEHDQQVRARRENPRVVFAPKRGGTSSCMH